jgi:acyl-CoA synthetase (AMP-forming)/AMP-acid ligase II
LRHAVEGAKGKIAVVDEEFYQPFKGTLAFEESSIFIKEGSLSKLYIDESPVIHPVAVHGSTTAAYLYTSGTTGRSKPCILSHRYFIEKALNLIDPFSITSSDILFCPFPLFHADATALTIVPTILTGCTAALSVRFLPRKFWDEIRATKATIYDFMGATLAMTCKQPPSPLDQDHNVRLAWGVPIPSWAGEYEKRFGHPIRTLYGRVETGLPIVQQGPRVPGACGTIRPGYELRIADTHDEALSVSMPGRLLLRATVPNVMFDGYFNNPEATLSAWTNLWIHTGDLAKVDV